MSSTYRRVPLHPRCRTAGRAHQSVPSLLSSHQQDDEQQQRRERRMHIEEACHSVAASTPDHGGALRQDTRHPTEDARVAIECRRERQDRFFIELAGAGHITRVVPVHGVSAFGAGCQAFVPELREVVWPPRFKPELSPHYDGVTNPIEFLQLYTTGIQAIGGGADVMVIWCPMALKDSARSWLMNLPEFSIKSWDDLCELIEIYNSLLIFSHEGHAWSSPHWCQSVRLQKTA